MAFVIKAEQVSLTQHEDGGGGVGEGGNAKVQRLFPQDKCPVRLEKKKHTLSASHLSLCTIPMKLN